MTQKIEKQNGTYPRTPDQLAYEQYMLLTEENKAKVIRYVESLKAEQCTPAL